MSEQVVSEIWENSISYQSSEKVIETELTKNPKKGLNKVPTIQVSKPEGEVDTPLKKTTINKSVPQKLNY